MKRLLAYALALVTLAAAGACSDSTGPAGSLTGTYSLRSIDGDPVPSVLFYASASNNIVIQSGDLTLFGDGRYRSRARVQDTEFGTTDVYDDESTGQWALSGNQLTLEDDFDFQNVTFAHVENGRIIIDGYGGYDASAEFVK